MAAGPAGPYIDKELRKGSAMRSIRLLAVAVLFGVSQGDAQRATFVGIVRDSATARPVDGVLLSVPGHSLLAMTDSAGRFVLVGVPSGDITIVLRRVGYAPARIDLALDLRHDAAVDLGTVRLSNRPVELDPMTVEATGAEERLEEVGFYSRMRSEIGTFLTYEDVARQNPDRTSDLLRRVPGFRALVSGDIASRRGIPSVSKGFSLCGVEYYIDGVHSAAPTIDVVLPAAIMGVEIYAGSATIPPAFRIDGNPKCGVIAIWTKDGRGGIPRR